MRNRDRGRHGDWSPYAGMGDEGDRGWDRMDGGRIEFGGGRRPGGHAGRGPKGYRRSDERIHEEIAECLTADDYLDATDLEIRVEDGVVTLSGIAADRSSKRDAEDIAAAVRGVHDVMNQIRVRREPERDAGNGGQRRPNGRRTERTET